MTPKRWLLAGLVLGLVAACDSTPGGETPATTTGGATLAPGTTGTVELADRPFQLHVPDSYEPAAAAPLVVVLHGFTSSAAEQESYFKLAAESDRRGFLYAMPDGTTDPDGERFWNATAACCDFYRTGVDDSAYLRRLLDTVRSSYTVDPARVYLVGHSNGGFMAYRMACEHATEITAIVSLAGAATNDPSQCTPERPVSVLQIHGTADRTIPYDGGANAGNPFPSVDGTLATWRSLNGCADQPDTSAAPVDLEADLPGPETTVTSYTGGCRDGSRVALWSIAEGGHVPALTADFAPAVVDFLYAQVRR